MWSTVVKILIVEDEPKTGEYLLQGLGEAGFVVDLAQNGIDGLHLARQGTYDLVILDVMLPGLDGFEILRRLRLQKNPVPVLVLTARSEIDDRVSALDLGADDYLVKPFDFRELEARARVLMRRRSGGEPTNIITCGDVALDRTNRNVRIGNREIQLKRREMSLLEILASRPGRIFSKQELLDHLFGFDEAPDQNAIELYVARLRKKLEGAESVIVTVRGLGYKLVAGP